MALSSQKRNIFWVSLEGFGDRLRKWRVSQGYSQQDLADTLGFSQPYYHHIEVGKRRPGAGFLEAIGQKAGLDVLADLLRVDREPAPGKIPGRVYDRIRKRQSVIIRGRKANDADRLSYNYDTVNPGLQDLLDDKELLDELMVSKEELDMLTRIHLDPHVRASKQFYVTALADYRQQLAILAREKSQKP